MLSQIFTRMKRLALKKIRPMPNKQPVNVSTKSIVGNMIANYFRVASTNIYCQQRNNEVHAGRWHVQLPDKYRHRGCPMIRLFVNCSPLHPENNACRNLHCSGLQYHTRPAVSSPRNAHRPMWLTAWWQRFIITIRGISAAMQPVLLYFGSWFPKVWFSFPPGDRRVMSINGCQMKNKFVNVEIPVILGWIRV